MSKSLTVLGSTGSIGVNTLLVAAQHADMFRIKALTGGNNTALLAQQALQFRPDFVAIQNTEKYAELKALLAGSSIEIEAGDAAVLHAAQISCDISVSAIMGAAALPPTLAAIAQGKQVGLANKEALVCAGPQMMAAVETYGTQLIPIDSEHNSIFQLIGDNIDGVKKMWLTASGGPFREYNTVQLQKVRAAEAVKHPNWKMGAKISVDSATMMNKGLELIEAYYLFGVPPEKLDAVIHPTSLVHALVEMEDHSILAGISDHDMCIPIAYALGYPQRLISSAKPLDISQIGSLDFEPVTMAHYPCFELAKQALITQSQVAHITLNAANEVAVEAFLQGRIGFMGISRVVAECLVQQSDASIDTLEEIYALDSEVRMMAGERVSLETH